MSIQAVAWVLDQDLPARPKLVLVAIANHASHTDGYCWLKAETIAAEAACSPRAVFNFVGDLIRNGYVRKAPKRGDDGKQRANDYWIMFNRAPAAWVSDRTLGDDAEEAGEPSADDDVTPQDVVEPDAPGACGEAVENSPENLAQHAPGAVGPHAPACSHSESAEPSKTKPEDARARARVPRSYQPPPPPPPEPVGAVAGAKAEMIFVFAPSKAYDAWCVRKSREIGRSWKQQTTREGRWGWYFPSLFPPAEKPPPGEKASTLATDADLDHFSKTG